jgi:hypothetical protein
MKKLLFVSLLSVFASNANASFIIDTMTGFFTTSDSKTNADTSDLANHTFIGASIDHRQKFYIGNNFTFFSHQIKGSTTNKVNTFELGPRATYFFSEENTFYVTLGWNPYAKGSRTVSGTQEDISGYAFLAGLGVEVKINRNFYVGGSLNYHTLNITKAISSSNVASTASDKYNSMMPMINLSLRFH